MIPRLLSKVDEVLRLPHLSDFHAVEVRAIAERIESLFLSIRDTVDDRHYELLTRHRGSPSSRNRPRRSRSRWIAQVYRIAVRRQPISHNPLTRARDWILNAMLTIKGRAPARNTTGRTDECKVVLNLDIDGYKSIELEKRESRPAQS